MYLLAMYLSPKMRDMCPLGAGRWWHIVDPHVPEPP